MQADEFRGLVYDAEDIPSDEDKTDAIRKARECFIKYVIGTHSFIEHFPPNDPQHRVSFHFQDGSFETLGIEVWTLIRGW